ncbi:cytochrome [Mycobacterium florentinum]|uniref:Cytochrome n=1 Tax=Mycobacterium florentinum TaxID=292462 RepID=A0A1X1UKM7_MYCFL|nr:cytochrome P450 [Mycobacterium florentinum]MCV7411454.1 cytochrome P450 [Mycobacterium florentinum]ORV57396.1 cytochrome [Mycobacterium florentinum]BBX80814.1 cytochrome P450 hydroxylase [Mycobacterium florentinum]
MAPVNTASPSVFDAGLPTIEYDVATATPAQLYPKFQAAQRLAPIALGPYGPEVLSYDLVRTMLRDNRFQIPPGYILAVQGITSGPLWDKVVNSLLGMEGAKHQRVRGVVAKAFTPRAVERLHATIVEVIDEIAEPISRRGHCDVVSDIARPYPVPVICALLGAPREDWQQFSLWADDIFKAFNFTFTAADVPDVMRAWGELDDYVDDMIARRRHTLTDDLLSDLIRAEHDGDRLNHDELRMLAAALLLAGTDTTRNQVAASIGVLCDHPDQWELLRDRPELAMTAVDETMRHSPIANSLVRVAAQDVELAGVLFPEGTMIFSNTAAANRDPAIYDDPDRFDITREGLPPVLNFGAGVHYCVGANLARLEIAEALRTVTRRIANPRKNGPSPWKPFVGLSGPSTLPIAFDT